MQTDELKEQLTRPSCRLFVDAGADVDLAREVGLSVGSHVFFIEDPSGLIRGIINMEAYFHHLRNKALEALKQQLLQRYSALAAISSGDHEASAILIDGTSIPLPGHTAPALNEFIGLLGPEEGCDNPRMALELIQQTIRLLQVLGMDRIELRSIRRPAPDDSQVSAC